MKFLDRVFLRIARRIHQAAINQAREEMRQPALDPVEISLQKKTLSEIHRVTLPSREVTEAVVLHVPKSSIELLRNVGYVPVPFFEKALIVKLHEVKGALLEEEARKNG